MAASRMKTASVNHLEIVFSEWKCMCVNYSWYYKLGLFVMLNCNSAEHLQAEAVESVIEPWPCF